MKLDYGWKSPQEFRKWGPYLSFGDNIATEMRISWQSKFFSMVRWIEYGETPSCELKLEKKIEPTCMHTFLIENLKPNTQYYYKISRSEDLQIKEQPIYTFTTGPLEGDKVKFNFSVFSDLHAHAGSGTKIFTSIKKNVPECNFVVSCGDIVTHGGEEESWNDFFSQFSPFSSDMPLMNATGNHDTDHPETYAHFVQTFHHPYKHLDDGAYYYFIYGNALFIMLDSDNAGQTTGRQGVISDDQMDWLEEVLEKYALKDYWVFIFKHHQFYSTGDFGIMNLYELAYKDLFEEYHVDGVFFGHDHHFEVFWPERKLEWGGTHYLLVGNGASSLDIKNRDPKREPYLPNYIWKGRTYIYERDGILDGYMEGTRNDELVKSAQIYGVMEQGFTNLEINGDECIIKMWGTENQIYFEDLIRRTGQGKKFHSPKFMRPF